MTPRRLIDEEPRSIEAQLLRVGRTMQPPASAYQKTLASLGFVTATLGSAKLATAATAKFAIGSTLGGMALQGIAVGVVVGASVLGAAQVTRSWHGNASSTQAQHAQQGQVATRPAAVVALTPAPVRADDAPAAEPVASDVRANVLVPRAIGSERLNRSEREPSPSAAPNSLGAEVGLIDDVRRALAQGQGERALSLLEQHGRQFPAPRLGEESSFLRAQVLTRLGRHAEAAQALERFRLNYPNSTLSEPR